jgi:hypothetical protein
MLRVLHVVPFIDGGFVSPDRFGDRQFWIRCAWMDVDFLIDAGMMLRSKTRPCRYLVFESSP